ncbi:diapophytoene dehydrogenase crtn [Heliomicrobium modesticaldum Ice1]|uniref:Diapophytoene dehydrogenase crtn n=1 Tax=Heliobacterium modesticaldum (strain ATCC 51547 / Ice1) TaxID=498761 RepID=B0TBN2_HELMI|nr:phytoene desaturase family protein [Heliomicrobium modesticaldum]ABZ83871.1 diapophytoene dehydrogenase crtn [Heliomicrobium modesticaldum Ice1]
MKQTTRNHGKVVVVGSGAGGLSAAVRLAAQGWDVTVLEKEATIGGRLSAVEADGYTIDIGPTILMMNDVFEQFFQDHGRDIRDYLELVRVDPCYHLHFTDGTRLTPSIDMKKLLDEIRSLNPDDVDGYLRYLAQIHRRYMYARHHFIEKAFVKPSDFFNPETLSAMLQLKTLNSMYDDIARFIKDERLRIALTFQAIYLGISPFDAPSIYTLIAYVEHGLSGVWYPKGGMNAIAKAMARLLGEFGGVIRCNAEVAQIRIENGRARGVRLVNGEEIVADVVISNADFPYTMEKLVEPAYRGKYRPEKLARMENTVGTFMLYLGVNKRYKDLHIHNIYFTPDYKKSMDELFSARILPEDPAMYVYSPTKYDATVAPPGKEVIYVLVPVPNLDSGIDWKKETSRYRELVLKKLERWGLTRLRQHIDFERIYTPETFQKRFNVYHGASFGLAPTLFQSGYFRPSIKSEKVSNLYFTGASVHPGGGVPVVLVCGKLVSDQVMKDNGLAMKISPNAAKGVAATF